MCPPPTLYTEILTLKYEVLGVTFQMWLGNEGGAVTNGISVLIKETSQSSLAPSTM